MKNNKLIGLIAIVVGAIFVVAGGVTYNMVHNKLADERITVSADAPRFAGQAVAGPFTAYTEAMIIQKHALDATGGKTYAELDREDPLRAVAMNGSFLRASLFTSVVSFGVAALAAGLGVMFILLGVAIRNTVK
jgi:ABC-type Fe3+-siderophore transport system permease subunit